MARFYITTAIPYVNARPHLGFALEIIQTDAFARYRRALGDEVRFLTGTDDNSLTNVIAAEAEGISTLRLVERNAAQYQALKSALTLSFDDFIRTSTDRRHLEGARKLWEACNANGDIYKKPYRGLYCNRCEQFYKQTEAADGNCPDHGLPLEVVEEENYFFKLTNYAARLERLISSDEYRVIPQSRKNEILSLIHMGLEDFSISRSVTRARGWGIPVPGDTAHVMYVWFDALSNYINALGYADCGPLYQRFWVQNPHRVHCIGKGIIRFHAVYWPAILLSAAVPLPTTLFVHGYITLAGARMSKSRGNVIDPVALAESYGVDSLRYYLLRRVHPTEDANFTLEHFVRTYNSDLADQLGNLLSRVTGMVGRYYEGVVPPPGAEQKEDARLRKTAAELGSRLEAAMVAFDPNDALAAVWNLIAEANRYVVEVEPWALAKSRADARTESRLGAVLYNLVEALRIIAWACSPFLPSTAERISARLGVDSPAVGLTDALEWGGTHPGNKIVAGGSLFPKFEPVLEE